jgi:hypothetical protein
MYRCIAPLVLPPDVLLSCLLAEDGDVLNHDVLSDRLQG